jgi:hypothetical protein
VTASVLRWVGRTASRTAEIGGTTNMVATVSARVSRSCLPLATELDINGKLADLDRRTKFLPGRSHELRATCSTSWRPKVDIASTYRRSFMITRATRPHKLGNTLSKESRVESLSLALVTLGTILRALRK